MSGGPVTPDPWAGLRAFTGARIGQGRAGGALPTGPLLDFQLAHGRARDAVHGALDVAALREALGEDGHEVLALHSAAADRAQYLQRPDLGRRLDEASRTLLGSRRGLGCDLLFVLADGLSPEAVRRHARPLLERLLPSLLDEGWSLGPLVLVEQGRVAIGDEIGEALGAALVGVLLGERPGLSSPDSLGAYLTFAPRVGRKDAERNCVSNIRPEGLDYAQAAHRLGYLIREARRRGLSGVALKEEAGRPALGPP